MAAGNLTIKEAIEKAVEEQEKPGENVKEEEKSKEDETKKSEESDDKSESDKEEEKEEDKSEDDEKRIDAETEEIETALNLLRALRDPSKSTNLIKDFAVRVGLIKEDQNLTKIEEKGLKDIIAEELGDEYPDLRDKITKILEASEAKSTKEIKALRDELANEKRQQAEQVFNDEFATFIKSNKLSEKEAALMVDQIKELPPSGNITLTKYLTKIHKLVVSDKVEEKQKIDQNARRTENQKDQVKNLSSGVDDDRIKKGSRLPTAREAIQAALRGEKLED